MISRYRGLSAHRRGIARGGFVALGALALGATLVAPTRVADSQFTHLLSVFGELKGSLRQAMEEARPPITAHNLGAPVPRSAQPSPPPDAKPQTAARTPDGAAIGGAYTSAMADDRLRALGVDPTNILDAVAAYKADKADLGDTLAARIGDPVARAALEWVALREVPQKVGLGRLQAFVAGHPGWPAARWLRNQMEARLLRVQEPRSVLAFFADAAPETPPGKLALARALKATGRIADGSKLARAVFRESDLTNFSEGLLRVEFGSDLTKGDFKYRADRLLYKDKLGPALRYAAQAGPDVLALAEARAAVIAEADSDKPIAAVPESLRNDPGLILAGVQKLRRVDKLIEAAHLMESAPHDASQLIDGDEWWTERRTLARKLLDDGKVNAAYIMCAMNAAVSNDAKVDAEFHAGWIALRFMHEPSRAAYHFGVAAKRADNPSAIAKIAYWQARDIEAIGDAGAASRAKALYETAAAQGSTYYGQIARHQLGLIGDPIRTPAERAIGNDRAEAVRVIELLYAAGEKDDSTALAVAAANTIEDPRQVGALADVVEREQDAHLALTIGKLIGQRGTPVDPLAFPTFGIPAYEALQNSAAAPVVYSVARQESAFLPGVVSKAGAKGLMQMIDATARHTAVKAGLPFDANRLLSDASFNAQLGAAHLGELISEQGGSLILTFAAYNAGGGRVKQWIDAYGDPRKPGVDPVDWVERIPFTETRNYVQRVMANVGMYQAIFAKKSIADRASLDTSLDAKL